MDLASFVCERAAGDDELSSQIDLLVRYGDTHRHRRCGDIDLYPEWEGFE